MMPQTMKLLVATLTFLSEMVKASSTPTCATTASNCEVNGNDVTCNATDTSNGLKSIDNCGVATCEDAMSCSEYVFSSSRNVLCTDHLACYGSDISNSRNVQCTADSACEEASVSDTRYLHCTGDESCKRSDVANVRNLVCSGGNYACYGATIFDIPRRGNILCGGPNEGNNAMHCFEANFESTQPYTLTCQNTPNGSNLYACGQGHITNPGGSVFCYGGPSVTGGACDNLSISDSIGCLICGNDIACYNVAIVDDGSGDTVLDVPHYPDNDVFVHPRCKSRDVLKYLNEVHPDGGVACEDGNSDGVCDVVEAYCANNPQDANCVQEFRKSWSKTTIR